MARTKTVFICTQCGHRAPKWEGKCVSCGEWNTYREEIELKETQAERRQKARSATGPESQTLPQLLSEIQTGKLPRLRTNNSELDRVLGGGIVPGSLVLIGGQPGIGKSTLLLQVAMQLRDSVLYVSGEESAEQIKMRADRLQKKKGDCLILTETHVERILAQAREIKPQLLIIDSIQTLATPHLDAMPGSISQIRECAGELQRLAKSEQIPVFLIGHITKDGSIAGPKVLEHMVDTVLHFEGDRNYTYRILRTLKNRFGSTDEMGIFEMHAQGLKEVTNPSELLLSSSEEDLSGSAVCATIEGQRPMLIETQGLVSSAVYGTPQRTATGFDLRRLSMLLAVVEKRAGFMLGQADVFLNMAGGIRVEDPAIDLAVVAAIMSSLEDIAIPKTTCLAGEVGLSGEIRSINRIELRIQEADRQGFRQLFLPRHNLKGLNRKKYAIELIGISKISELHELLFS